VGSLPTSASAKQANEQDYTRQFYTGGTIRQAALGRQHVVKKMQYRWQQTRQDREKHNMFGLLVFGFL
jgi:hypothetical protein